MHGGADEEDEPGHPPAAHGQQAAADQRRTGTTRPPRHDHHGQVHVHPPDAALKGPRQLRPVRGLPAGDGGGGSCTPRARPPALGQPQHAGGTRELRGVVNGQSYLDRTLCAEFDIIAVGLYFKKFIFMMCHVLNSLN